MRVMKMKLHSDLGAKQFMQILVDKLDKESNEWYEKIYKRKAAHNEIVSGQERDKAVHWLIALNRIFHFGPETVALAIYLLDTFLSSVKVHPKYLHCAGVTCLYLAAKALEEDEIIPSTTELVRQSQCGCSISEILRMEIAILKKLKWNLKFVTAIDFLHVVHALLMIHHPHLLNGTNCMTPSHHLAVLSEKLLHCIADHTSLVFRPITLVLALVTLELERISVPWFPVAVTFQRLAEIDSNNLIRCRELISNIIHRKTAMARADLVRANRAMKRKVDEVDEDDIYDGIKRLYNEDITVPINPGIMRASCSKEVHQDPDRYSTYQAVSAN